MAGIVADPDTLVWLFGRRDIAFWRQGAERHDVFSHPDTQPITHATELHPFPEAERRVA